ncbi:VanZ family protein [Microbacterium fluvii]|uniref:VanZ family protein n=1 Tax=Microbacterium fluvii TaxID=415215 RepID=A0ABW2HGB8_9MICO|nr:VanZ family protein [Microbacterium fluvii]MCU4673819.1 VanZ family protein [Microbacterium fluvii]
MDDRILLGVLAVGAGLLVGVALFVPFVALSYRRRGGLSFWRFVGWAAFLIYFFAIWTYTLLPLPDPDAIRCVGAILDPMVSVDEVVAALGGPGNPLTSPQVLQLALNVLLFVPLGFFVRVLLGRGFVVTVLIGFAVSLFVELTQLTGVWGIYPCAYRFFDVGDLITNTTGAAVGAVLSLLVPRRHRGFARTADADDPDPVTKPRRLLAMVCDYLGATVVSAAVAVGVQLVLLALGRRDLAVDGTIGSFAGAAASAVLWLVVVLATGRTIGDRAVELRYTGSSLPVWAARVLRYLGGIGGYLVLSALPAPWSGLAGLLALVGAVMLLTTRRGRGLPGVLSGQELVDARSPRVPPGGVEVS